MSLKDRILREWSFPVVNEADRPNRAAQNMKEIFDSNSNEIRDAINGVISDIEAGDSEQTFEEADARENIESGDTLAVILGKIKKWFNDLREAVTVIRTDEDPLKFLRGDGQYAIPQAGEAINGIPSNGRIKSVLFKRSSKDFEVAWGGPSDIGAAAQSFEATATLLAANWSGNTYTLRLDGVTENNAIEMLPPESADITDEQLSALQEANIQDGGQSENILVFVARGKVPEIDLPVRFIIRGDLGDGTRGGYDGADILNENEIILQRHLPEGFPYDSTIWIRAEEQVAFANGEAEVYGDPLDHRITIGESYVVTWNGEEYNVECDASDLGLSRLRVDSLFSIVAMPRQFVLEGGAQLVLQDEIGLGTATFSIKRPGGEITKIDEKYLPDDIGGGDQVLGEDGKIKPELLPENIGGGDEVLNENGVIKQEHLPELFPYYKRVGVPETEITLTDGTATLQDPLPIVVGNTYSVGWNGSWYRNLVATGNDEMGDGSGVISKTLSVEGVFRIYCYPDAFISMGAPGAEITAYDGSETVTLEIVGTEITKMGEGLLPDSVNNAVKTLDDMIDDEGNIRYEYLPNDIPYKGKGYILEPTDFTLDVLEDDETIAYLPYRLPIERQKEYVLEWNGRKHTLPVYLYGIPKPNATSDTVYGYGVEYYVLYSGGSSTRYYGVYVYDEEVFEETGIGSCIISHRDNVTSAKVAVHGDIVKPIAEECLPDSAKVLNSDGIIKQEHLPEGYPYSYKGEGVLLEENNWIPSDDGTISMNKLITFYENEQYSVNWNGTAYTCTPIIMEEEGITIELLGNYGALSGEGDTGEPFIILAGADGTQIAVLDGSESVSITITGAKRIVKELDSEYIQTSLEVAKSEVIQRLWPVHYVSTIDIGLNQENLEYVDLGGTLMSKTLTADLTILGKRYFFELPLYRLDDVSIGGEVFFSSVLFLDDTGDTGSGTADPLYVLNCKYIGRGAGHNVIYHIRLLSAP